METGWKPMSLGALHAAIPAARTGKATKHIHMEFYIFEDDAIGRLRDVLMEKARAGAEVRVIYDDVGCLACSQPFFEEMRRAGIEGTQLSEGTFSAFSPVR